MADRVNPTTISLAVAPVREVRRDLARNLPWLLLLLGLAALYVLASTSAIRAFEDSWPFGKACYFTVINLTTVGFGDVTPSTTGGKVIACINAVAGLLFFGVLVAVMALALQPAGYSGSLQVSGKREREERPSREAAVEDVGETLSGIAETLRSYPRRFDGTWRKARIIVHHYDPDHLVIEIERRGGVG